MIRLNDVLNIHDILIDKFGGTKGVRDQGALESAINRPYATFGEIVKWLQNRIKKKYDA